MGGGASSTQNLTPRRFREQSEKVLAEKKRITESLEPLPIKKSEQLTKSEAGDMKLVQQYVMIRGRLQPALKYVAPIPMFNRYKVQNGQKEEF